MPKPQKPYPEFPLTPHVKGWFCRHNGKPRFVCGHVSPDEAMIRFAEKRQVWDAEDGTGAQPVATDNIPIVDLADAFLDSKEARKNEGTLDARTYREYDEAIRDFVTCIGPLKPVAHVRPEDFAKHRLALAQRFGPDRKKKFMILVRGMFKWGVENQKIARLPLYGNEYALPSKREFRIKKAEHEQQHGKMMFTPEEVAKLLEQCESVNLHGMILLALNGGYGNTDVSAIPTKIIDLYKGVIDYHRGKTGMHRRVILWPRTIKAIKAVIPKRPAPADDDLTDRLFLTRFGREYVRENESEQLDGTVKGSHKDQIGMQFLALCRKAGIYRPNRNFYALRHTFRTYADECHDPRAVARLMGHELDDMGTAYVEFIADDRLRSIVDHVHQKLFGVPIEVVKPAKAGKAKRKKHRRAATVS